MTLEIYRNLIGGSKVDINSDLIGGDAPVPFYLGIADLNPVASVDVTTVGAKGDGVTDDTAAINAATAAGNVLYFPKTANFYKTTLAINLKASAWSNGAEIRILQDGTHQQSVFRVTANTVPIVIYGFILNGLYAGGTVSEFSSGVEIWNASNVTVAFNTIKDVYGDNVSIYQFSPNELCTNITVRDNIMSNPRRCNVAITGVSGALILNNTCTKTVNYVSAIDLEPDPNGYSFINNVTIAGNSFIAVSNIITALVNNGIPHTNLVIKRNTGNGFRLFQANSDSLITGATMSDNIYTAKIPTQTAAYMFSMDTVKNTSLIRNADLTMPTTRVSLFQVNSTLSLNGNVFY